MSKDLTREDLETIRAAVKPGDGWDGDDWELQLCEAAIDFASRATPSSANGAEGLPEDALHSQYFGKLLSRLVEFGFEGGHDENLIDWIRAYARAAVMAERAKWVSKNGN